MAGRLRIVRYDVHEDGTPPFGRDEASVEFHGTLEPGGHCEVLDLELAGASPDAPDAPDAAGLRLTLRVAS